MVLWAILLLCGALLKWADALDANTVLSHGFDSQRVKCRISSFVKIALDEEEKNVSFQPKKGHKIIPNQPGVLQVSNLNSKDFHFLDDLRISDTKSRSSLIFGSTPNTLTISTDSNKFKITDHSKLDLNSGSTVMQTSPAGRFLIENFGSMDLHFSRLKLAKMAELKVSRSAVYLEDVSLVCDQSSVFEVTKFSEAKFLGYKQAQVEAMALTLHKDAQLTVQSHSYFESYNEFYSALYAGAHFYVSNHSTVRVGYLPENGAPCSQGFFVAMDWSETIINNSRFRIDCELRVIVAPKVRVKLYEHSGLAIIRKNAKLVRSEENHAACIILQDLSLKNQQFTVQIGETDQDTELSPGLGDRIRCADNLKLLLSTLPSSFAHRLAVSEITILKNRSRLTLHVDDPLTNIVPCPENPKQTDPYKQKVEDAKCGCDGIRILTWSPSFTPHIFIVLAILLTF